MGGRTLKKYEVSTNLINYTHILTDYEIGLIKRFDAALGNSNQEIERLGYLNFVRKFQTK